MPRDGGGVYSLPGGYQAVTGQTIQASQHNPPLEDIASALTNSLPRNGAAPMTDDLDMADNAIQNVSAIDLSGAMDFAGAATIASATTTDIGGEDTNSVVISGTTTITGFGSAAAGVTRWGRFSGALTLTHNATSLILPSGASITTAAGDTFFAQSEGSGNWRVLSYIKANGKAIVVDAPTSATTSAEGVVELATDAELQSATSGKAVTTGQIESASAFVALTETAGAVAVDWDTFINGEVTVDQATAISNPTNGQPGTWRTIIVKGNDATDRAITFGNQFLGEVPTITDCDTDRWYALDIQCVTTSHFAVTARKVKGT